MAGHSHAHNIKHKKNATDAKRAKIFTKLCREITSAAKQFGPDSARLKVILDNARKNNLPKDNIDRALKKALDTNAADNMEEIIYEGFSFAGIAFMIEACTDNRNRTSSKLREILRKFDGDLGSCAYLFEYKGIISYQTKDIKIKNNLLNHAIELDPMDIEENMLDSSIDSGIELDYNISIICKPNDFYHIQETLAKYCDNNTIIDSCLLYQAYEEIPLNNLSAEQQQKYHKLLNLLENSDDVEEVYSNINENIIN